MNVDPRTYTVTFDNRQEAEHAFAAAKDVILRGQDAASNHWGWIWEIGTIFAGDEPRHALLLVSTVVPQRVLLGVVEYLLGDKAVDGETQNAAAPSLPATD